MLECTPKIDIYLHCINDVVNDYDVYGYGTSKKVKVYDSILICEKLIYVEFKTNVRVFTSERFITISKFSFNKYFIDVIKLRKEKLKKLSNIFGE